MIAIVVVVVVSAVLQESGISRTATRHLPNAVDDRLDPTIDTTVTTTMTSSSGTNY